MRMRLIRGRFFFMGALLALGEYAFTSDKMLGDIVTVPDALRGGNMARKTPPSPAMMRRVVR
jgi:hypothetical protein